MIKEKFPIIISFLQYNIPCKINISAFNGQEIIIINQTVKKIEF